MGGEGVMTPAVVPTMVVTETKPMSKEFEGYPIRRIRLSDTEWKELKRQKEQSNKTWNNYIKDLCTNNMTKPSQTK